MVRAPVGHHAAGILVPVAEGAVRPLRDVFRLRGGAEPHVPVEALGHGPDLERPAARSVRDARLHPPDLAEPAIADQLAGQAEPGVGSLLAADLEDPPGLMMDADQLPALLDKQGERLLAVDVLAGPQ